jgi:hypothetical protein
VQQQQQQQQQQGVSEAGIPSLGAILSWCRLHYTGCSMPACTSLTSHKHTAIVFTHGHVELTTCCPLLSLCHSPPFCSMVPHKTKRGAAALERLKCFEGVPPPYDKVKRLVVPDALQVLRLQHGHRFCKLGQLAQSVSSSRGGRQWIGIQGTGGQVVIVGGTGGFGAAGGGNVGGGHFGVCD